jgi:uncharacterized membrane protein
MAGWLLPTIAYVVLIGAAGITTKLALRSLEWQQMVYWLPIAYVAFCAVLWLVYKKPVTLEAGGWAGLTALAMAAGLIVLFYALSKGDASAVVPASSAYPVIALIGSALFLAESITVPKVLGD